MLAPKVFKPPAKAGGFFDAEITDSIIEQALSG